MIRKFRKKPVEIEAVKYTGLNEAEVRIFCHPHSFVVPTSKGRFLYIKTLEGDMEVSVGDFIIKGIKGEFYPCKSDIFELTYEAVME